MCKSQPIKECLNCKNPFHKKSKASLCNWDNRKYCSTECSDIGHIGNKSTTGQKRTEESKKKQGDAIRGDKNHNWVNRDSLPKKECIKCGKSYQKTTGETQAYWETRKYCSLDCSKHEVLKGNKYNLGRIKTIEEREAHSKKVSKENHPGWLDRETIETKSCMECNIVFKRNPSHGLKAWETRKFCSRECYNKDKYVDDDSEKARLLRIRKRGITHKWRKQILIRDNYICQECGSRDNPLEVHHIIPLRINEEKFMDEDNGITLCTTCHKRTYNKEHLFEEKYQSIVDSKMAQYSMANPISSRQNLPIMGTLI
jgi:5-methylcytosine-specific restriction endonuclease McrA